MVRSKGSKRSLSVGERDGIKELKQEAVATLKHAENNPGATRSIDKERLEKEISNYDRIIADGTPKTPYGKQKDELHSRADVLAEEIQKGMPSRDQMDHPAKNPGAVRKHINWSKVNDPKIREYREIMKRLEPHDPTAGDIERFRRSK